jgi:hypothetical protein
MAGVMKPVSCLAIVYESGGIFIDSSIKYEVQLSGLIKPGEKASIKRVTVSEAKRRSLTANGLFHVWCQTLSGFTGEPVNATKQGLKIKFGFPILLADPEDGQIFVNILNGLNWASLDWETKVKRCEKYIPVTSIMAPAQLKLMMDNIKNWAQHQYNVTLDNGKAK